MRTNAARLLLMTVALTLSGAASIEAQAKTSDLIDYLHPQKKTYQNGSQDRKTSRNSFKQVDIAGAPAIPNKEIGLFARLDAKLSGHDDELNTLLRDPRLSGLSAVIPWRILAPSENQYDWQPIDKLLRLCQDNNKSLILRISTSGANPGSDLPSLTPPWVFAAGAKSIDENGESGKHQTPVYWDPIYQAKWANFVGALGLRYDGNQALHSVGITGGGNGGGTEIESRSTATKNNSGSEDLWKTNGMSEQKLVQNWKYIADLFARAFTKTPLNFDIDPPTPDRAGQAALDEIANFIVFRYGERVYLTRQNIDDARHGFDQYRLFSEFRPDTLLGYQLSNDFPAADKMPSTFQSLVKDSFDDGVSFFEIPPELLANQSLSGPLAKLRAHLGYQLLLRQASLPPDIKSGAPLTAEFTFINIGDAVPMRPIRQLEKDIPGSYKVQLELRDTSGKPVVVSLGTPEVPTNQWLPGKPVTWQQDLKLGALAPGEYSMWLSLVESHSQGTLRIFDASSGEKHVPETSIAVGKIRIVAN